MVNNFNNINSDNLYKYIAIFGLVILLSSGIYSVSNIISLEQQQMEILADTERLGAEIKGINEEIDFYKDRKELSEEEHVKRYLINPIKLRIKDVALKSKKRLHNLLGSQIQFLFNIGVWGLVIGLLSIVCGFLVWAKKVQKFQNIALKNISEKNDA